MKIFESIGLFLSQSHKSRQARADELLWKNKFIAELNKCDNGEGMDWGYNPDAAIDRIMVMQHPDVPENHASCSTYFDAWNAVRFFNLGHALGKKRQAADNS